MANDKRLADKPVKAVLKADKANAAKLKGAKTAAPAKKGRKFDLKKTVQGIARFFREVVSELKKVTWPSRNEFLSYTAAVLVFVTMFGVIIFLIDLPLGWLVSLLSNI